MIRLRFNREMFPRIRDYLRDQKIKHSPFTKDYDWYECSIIRAPPECRMEILLAFDHLII